MTQQHQHMPHHPTAMMSGFALSCLGLAACLSLSLGLATPAHAAGKGTPGAARESAAPVTLNFVNADIEAVTRAVSSMVNKPMLVDPRVKGTITLYSERPLSPREAYQNYLSALRGLGFAVVESAGLLKVVPEADAKLQTSVVTVDGHGGSAARGDQVITQVFKLNHENPNNLVAVLRPLISPNNTINANPGNSSLVITDYADNLSRMAKIIAALDQSSNTDVEIVPLQHAIASDIAALVQKLGDGSLGGAVVPGGTSNSTVLAEPRSNSLIIRAPSAAKLNAMRSLISKLDKPGAQGPAGTINVVYLKNADAAKLATVLRAAFGGGSGGGGSSGGSGSSSTSGGLGSAQGAQGGGLGGGNSASNTGTSSAAATAPVASSAQPSTGGFIQADAATNSLVITAPDPLYKQIRTVIDQLDGRRAQLYIESMIVEVSGNDGAEVGFQWLGGLNIGTNTSIQGAQTLPSSSSPGIVDINTGLATGTISLGSGLNLGLARTINGVTSLGTILRLLQSQGNVNIVSTPNLITLDNEEAKIVVGENVPFITGQYTTSGSTTSNPFQTIERKDVGITLRIRPQIGENGAVRMQIYQEQSSVKESTATSTSGPTTTKRGYEGTVTVDDGQILALGGLIEDNYTTSKSKVPLLGDIPVLGALFRSESRTRKRSNLMVFLRPVVLRDAESTRQFSLDRYEQIRGTQKDSQPNPSVVMPINESIVLPPMREAPARTPMAEPAITPVAPVKP